MIFWKRQTIEIVKGPVARGSVAVGEKEKDE